MKISAKVSVAALALALMGGAALASRQTAPESILPPGFNEPVTPTPAPAPRRTPTSILPGPTPTPGAAASPSVATSPADSGGVLPTPSPTPSATPTPVDLSAYELPGSAKRSLNAIGAIGPDSGGLGATAFGRANGRMTQILMRRLDAPLPSRWLSIALRRALTSRVAPPAGINGADFAAERAWLLIRMGEADMARALVQSVDVEDYTPKLFQVAMQAMLATGDPAGLCPLAEPASRVSNETGWAYARAMCAGLASKTTEAGQLFNAARKLSGRGIDSLLAEKVVGAGGGRSVTIEPAEWNGVDRLTAWRYGLAMATGVAIPEELYGTVNAQVAGWRATSPMLDPITRVGIADIAAAQGILSSLALVDLYGEIAATDDSNSAAGATARDLRSASAEGTPDERVAQLRRLWDEPTSARGKFARLVLTARASARIAPDAKYAGDSGRLVASMLTAGFDIAAERWRSVTPSGSDGWAMLALASSRGGMIGYGAVNDYQGNDSDPDKLKTKMLVAGLAGLGRLSAGDAERLGQALGVRFGEENGWTRAITAAAARREAGAVVLLSAVAMQTTNWRGVPPEMLFRSVAALRAVGMEAEARMIVAEAIARL